MPTAAVAISPVVQEVRVKWSTSVSDALWVKLTKVSATISETGELLLSDVLQQSVDASEDEEATEDEEALVLVAIPEQEAGSHFLQVSVSRKPPSAECSWTLFVRRKPANNPPEILQRLSATVNGVAGLMSLIQESVASAGPTVAQYLVTLQFGYPKWRCLNIPRELRETDDSAVLKLARSVRLEQIGYRLEGGAIGIEEVSIVFLHNPSQYIVPVVARGLLEDENKSCLHYVENVTRLVQHTFFRQESPDAA